MTFKTHSYEAKDSSKSYPKLKLTYFDIPGRAEPIRTALFIGGIPFEDERVTWQQWGEFKPNTKYGQLPLLEIDGKTIAETNALLHYAGELAGLVPSDPVERAKVNELLFLQSDIGQEIFPIYAAKTDEEKAAAKAQFAESLKSKGLFFYNRAVEENGGKYLVGNSLTIADLSVKDFIDYLVSSGWGLGLGSGPLDHFPALKAYTEGIQNDERVKAWKEAYKAQEGK